VTLDPLGPILGRQMPSMIVFEVAGEGGNVRSLSLTDSLGDAAADNS